MESCISGGKVDRPPVALWRHFPVDDQSPTDLARSIILFQQTYDFDFIKITPASSYCIQDYGGIDVWRGNPEGTREYVSYAIKSASDWLKLPGLSPHEGNLSNTLDCIRQVRAGIPQDTPVVQTIFDPMSQAKNLVGRETLLAHMRQNPEELKAGLRRITENTIAFIKECLNLGVDGIFFAVQHAQASLLNRSELNEFVIDFDQEILQSAASLWMNILHIHGNNIYFDEINRLPAAIINWHDQETSPSLAVAKTIFNGAVCGGLRQWDTLAYASPAEVAVESQNAIDATRGERFILGTGCVLPIIAPHSNILAVRNAVESSK